MASSEAQPPDHRKDHHEPLHFAFYHYVSDELKWATPTTSLGSGTALDVFKRAK